MLEELVEWLRKDKFTIALTIICAFAPLYLDIPKKILGESPNVPQQKCQEGKSRKDFYEKEKEMALWESVLIIGALGVVIFNYHPSSINSKMDENSLKQYIEDHCDLRQSFNNTSESACTVVRKTVKQFYHWWIALWWVWLICYMGIFIIMRGIPSIYNDFSLLRNLGIFKSLCDFATSTIMFALYFILNNVTVNEITRNIGALKMKYLGITVFIFLLTIFVLLQMAYLTKSDETDFAYYTQILLGTFSAMTMVLLLGNFNSNYLQVPRVFMYILYIYAISQAFTIFGMYPDEETFGELYHTAKKISFSLPWISFFGKATLLITMSWILHDRRFIFYIIHKSQTITRTRTMLRSFNHYME